MSGEDFKNIAIGAAVIGAFYIIKNALDTDEEQELFDSSCSVDNLPFPPSYYETLADALEGFFYVPYLLPGPFSMEDEEAVLDILASINSDCEFLFLSMTFGKRCRSYPLNLCNKLTLVEHVINYIPSEMIAELNAIYLNNGMSIQIPI